MKLETAQRLYEYRKKNGYSQEELAEKIGVSRQAVSKWERNESSPDTDNLIALAELYGITIDELLNGKKPNTAAARESAPPQSNYAANNAYNNHTSPDPAEIKPEKSEKSPWHALLPLGTVAAYLILGFTAPRGWACGWLLFFLIPIVETLVSAIKKKNPAEFAFPVLITAIYLTGGMLFGFWHPSWILFFLIPVYYIACSALRKSKEGGAPFVAPVVIICSVAAVLIAGVFCTFSFLKNLRLESDLPTVNSGNFTLDYENEGDYSIGSAEIPAESIKNINIEWVSGSVTLAYYDGDKISFSEPEQREERCQLRYLVNGDTLELKFCKPSTLGLKENNFINKDLIIKLPQGMALERLDISGVSAPIIAESLAVREFICNTVSGDIYAKGNIESITSKSVSADVIIETGAVPEKLNANSVSGSVKLTVPPQTPGFTVKMDSVSGDVTFNNFREFGEIKLGKNIHTYGDGSMQVNFHSVSGDLTLTKTELKAE